MYGETQQELADAIHYARTYITQLETGAKNINIELIDLICDHYHISVNDFMNEDYSEGSNDLVIKGNSTDKLLRKMFHLVQTPQAKCNSHFIKGCEKAITAIFGDEDYARMISLVQSAIDEYKKSIEDGIEYAPDANIIALILFRTALLYADEIDSNTVDCIEQSLTLDNRKKRLRLATELDMVFEKKKAQIKQLDELLIPHFINLKKSVSFSMLADYYCSPN